MIDPQPISRDVARHELRSSFGRVKQDLSVLNDMFTGKGDTFDRER